MSENGIQISRRALMRLPKAGHRPETEQEQLQNDPYTKSMPITLSTSYMNL